MVRLSRLLPTLLLGFLALGVPSTPAGAAEPQVDGSRLTLPKLVAVRQLRCDTIRRGKENKTRSEIARAELSSARPMDRMLAERKIQDAEAATSAVFEEAGRLRQRLERMGEAFIASRRKEWHATPDEAERIRIEELIFQAREILEVGCDSP